MCAQLYQQFGTDLRVVSMSYMRQLANKLQEDRVPQRPSSSSLGTHFQRVSMSQLPFHHLVVRGQGARFCNEELVNITAFDCGQQE